MKTIFIVTFGAFLVLFSLPGCDVTENSDSNRLEGKWFEDAKIEEGLGLFQRLEYTFSKDNTFEVKRIIIDSSTKKIIGYRFLGYGIYSLIGNQLEMSTSKEFIINQQPEPLFVQRDELAEYKTEDKVVIVKLNIVIDKMTWYYTPFGHNENCISTQVLDRAKYFEF